LKRLLFLCIVFLCIPALSLVITGCGQTQSTAPVPDTTNSKIYENEYFGYSCLYPAGWELQANPGGMLVLFAGPMDTDDEFIINVNIFVEELTEYAGISLDDYTENSEVQFHESLDDYQRLALDDTIISGMAARLVTYSFSIDTFKIKGTQAFFIRDNKAYIITYSATPETHSQYYSEFELIFASLVFK